MLLLLKAAFFCTSPQYLHNHPKNPSLLTTIHNPHNPAPPPTIPQAPNPKSYNFCVRFFVHIFPVSIPICINKAIIILWIDSPPFLRLFPLLIWDEIIRNMERYGVKDK